MELEKGIVLKTIDYQENSKIIYLLTNRGIVSAIVRGAKNLKSHTYAYAQPLVKIEFELKKDRYIGADHPDRCLAHEIYPGYRNP